MGIQERLKQIAGLAGRGVIPGGGAPPVNFHPVTVRDQLGRVLELGDEVLTVQPNTHLRVAQIARIPPKPGMPPDVVEMVLVARVLVAVPNGASIDSLYFLRHASEIKDGFLKNIGAEPDAPPPPAEPSGDPTTKAQVLAADSPPGPVLHLTDRD